MSQLRRSGMGFWMTAGTRSDDAVKAALAEESVWLKELPNHVMRLKQLFAGHDAFDVIACILLAQAANESRPLPARDMFLDSLVPAEYAALVLVERPGRLPTLSSPVLDLEATIIEALKHLRGLSLNAPSVLSQYWHRPADDALAAVHQRFVSRYICVPINETDAQAREWLREMFTDPRIERWMRSTLAFGVDDAERLIDAMLELIAEREVWALPADRNPVGIGQHVAFTPAEIASRGDVSESAAVSLCKLVSQGFGQRSHDWPTLPTPIRHRPLLADAAGYYCAAAPAWVRRGLRHTLAAALNPKLPEAGPGDDTTFQVYIARRGSLLESRAMVPLTGLLRPDYRIENLHFRVRGSDGRQREGEIDGLIVLDRKAIVVQAKSAATRIDALAEDATGFARALRAIVTESMRQHDDAREALIAPRDSVTFWRRQDGHQAMADPPELATADILPVTVTLDDLSGVAPVSWELRDAGVATAGPLPWLVGATPLELMLPLLVLPAQFVQFLRRRSELNESRNLAVADETDVFLEYLHDRLEGVYDVRFEGTERVLYLPPERFRALGEWLDARSVGDKRVRRPRQKLHRGMSALLNRLDRDRPVGWLDVSIAVLDVPRQFDQRVGSMATKALGVGRGSAWSLTYPTLDGDLRSLELFREPLDSRLDDEGTLRNALARARRAGASRLTALVAPEDRSTPLRVLSAGKAV
jgi:hypothetical protein